ncbi:conserved hypothetical protein [Neospora caninum Liverpool]|uniref:Transmembrane protein n=1 Tax=Neospora caninum (strain Liverpool) TaxID=572307 RepID=F0VJV8_NEOCL|nr:conserved hypothetical protein [Neospora caninum Liverpool]CBZ54019.1 conserved hypothetical protein [Neospora caninum Liverpool]CEL68023.1 TPA: hypothetical protein BN1204_038020 [Neospora caninum Liverpool]|eukprot:XP_003884051.1 conserved hypothetical protein [Neospora caninum Liverpool]
MATAEPGTPPRSVDASREAQSEVGPSDSQEGAWTPQSLHSSLPNSSLCLRLAVASASREGKRDEAVPSSSLPTTDFLHSSPQVSFRGQPRPIGTPRTVSFQLPSPQSSQSSGRPRLPSSRGSQFLPQSTSPSSLAPASAPSRSASPRYAPLHSPSAPCVSGRHTWAVEPGRPFGYSLSAPLPRRSFAPPADGNGSETDAAAHGLARKASDGESDCTDQLNEGSTESASCCSALCKGYNAPTKWEVHAFFSCSLLALACVLFCVGHIAAGLALCAVAAVALFLVRAERHALSLHLLLVLTVCAFALATAWAVREGREIERTELLRKQETLFTKHLAALEQRAETLRTLGGGTDAEVAREKEEIEERKRTALSLLRRAARHTRKYLTAANGETKTTERRRQDQFLASFVAAVSLLFALFLLNFAVAGYLGYLPFYFFVYQNVTVAFFSFRGLYAGLLCGATPAICFVLFCLKAYVAAGALLPLLILALGMAVASQVTPCRRARARKRPSSSPSESTLSSAGAQSPSPEEPEQAEKRRRRSAQVRLTFETLLVVVTVLTMAVQGLLLTDCVKERGEKNTEDAPGGAEAQDSEAPQPVQDVLSLYRSEALFSLLLCQELILLLSLLALLPRLVVMIMWHRKTRKRAHAGEALGARGKTHPSSLTLVLLGAPCPAKSAESDGARESRGSPAEAGATLPLPSNVFDMEEGRRKAPVNQELDEVEVELIGRYEVRRNRKDDTFDFRYVYSVKLVRLCDRSQVSRHRLTSVRVPPPKSFLTGDIQLASPKSLSRTRTTLPSRAEEVHETQEERQEKQIQSLLPSDTAIGAHGWSATSNDPRRGSTLLAKSSMQSEAVCLTLDKHLSYWDQDSHYRARPSAPLGDSFACLPSLREQPSLREEAAVDRSAFASAGLKIQAALPGPGEKDEGQKRERSGESTVREDGEGTQSPHKRFRPGTSARRETASEGESSGDEKSEAVAETNTEGRLELVSQLTSSEELNLTLLEGVQSPFSFNGQGALSPQPEGEDVILRGASKDDEDLTVSALSHDEETPEADAPAACRSPEKSVTEDSIPATVQSLPRIEEELEADALASGSEAGPPEEREGQETAPEPLASVDEETTGEAPRQPETQSDYSFGDEESEGVIGRASAGNGARRKTEKASEPSVDAIQRRDGERERGRQRVREDRGAESHAEFVRRRHASLAAIGRRVKADAAKRRHRSLSAQARGADSADRVASPSSPSRGGSLATRVIAEVLAEERAKAREARDAQADEGGRAFAESRQPRRVQTRDLARLGTNHTAYEEAYRRIVEGCIAVKETDWTFLAPGDSGEGEKLPASDGRGSSEESSATAGRSASPFSRGRATHA